MQRGSPTSTSERRTDYQACREAAPGAVPHAGHLLHYLMKSLLGEAQELNLGDRFQSRERQTEGRPDNHSFGQRHIDDSLISKLGEKPVRSAENTAEFPYILAEDHDFIVSAHGRADRFSYRFEHVHQT